MGAGDTLCRWYGHFETVLNVCSSFADGVVQSAQQRPVRADMMVPPTEDEVMRTLGKLKVNKAGRKNGVLPEMLKRLWRSAVCVHHQAWICSARYGRRREFLLSEEIP